MQEQVLTQVSLPPRGSFGTAPEGYFNSLQKTVLSEVEKPAKVYPIRKKSWIGMAASIVLLVGVSIWLLPNINTPQTAESLASLTTAEYLDFVSDELTLDDFADLITEDDIEAISMEIDDEAYLELLDLDQLLELEKTL